MNKSESITELAKALCKFQSEVKNPANTANNPFFKSKYAPLNDILNLVRPILSKHGLAILQMPGGDSQETSIVTLLMHESGEWIATEPLTMKSVKNDPQGAGSVITYARRYSLSAVLGISSEDDDDANGASGLSDKKEKPSKNKDKDETPPPPSWGGPQGASQAPSSAKGKPVNEAQLKRLYAICKSHGVSFDEMKKKVAAFGFESHKDLDKNTYDLVCEWAENYDQDNFIMPEEE